MPVAALPPEALRRRPPGDALLFETTDDLEDLEDALGQERAAEALRLAIALDRDGYNAYVLGPPGLGKHDMVRRMLGHAGAEAATPSDWCYLHDFAEPRRPRAVELPPGRGQDLRRDMERLTEELRVAIPAAFESADYRTRTQILEKQLEEAREKALERVRKRAEERNVALLRTPLGLAFAPAKGGEVLDPEEFHKLPEEEQERYRREIGELQSELQETLRGMPELERKHRERIKEANREVALYAAGSLLEELRRRWADLPAVLAHLDAVKADVVENVHEFLATGEEGDAAGQMRKLLSQSPALRRYGVNVLVDHADRKGAPVVYEDLPTHANLVGRIEHHAHFGTLVTDFTLIRPGALHRANGGFLVLDARKLLVQPFAWEELKRALRSREVRIETPERLLGFAGTSTLEPDPIPLHVKVVLVGERLLYHLLLEYDSDFGQLFKVAADFADRIPRSDRDYARLIATLARRDRLRPLDRAAVTRVLDEAARRAGDAERLTAELEPVRDLLREADHRAAEAGRSRVGEEDVRAAVAARQRRAGRVRELLLEEIDRGTIVVETAGARVGQVNGLSVLVVGGEAFGRPSRITARVRLGKGEVVDIEREVALGGPIHSKGVLILGGFLGGRYAREAPLTLSASLVFEQSYGGVEGDSASAAELCALLSAVGEIPLRQSVAVTGSVDQHGRLQAVGGVNEKVEGFFEVCRARGLTGEQGAVVPAANAKNLVLRDEVIEAVQAGRFRVYAVEHVDEAMEILTGLPAGTPGPDGRFPAGS
ncbi:MAG TPA: ATP-binding protein, partial [Anaeromyxobacteraceae bacterium]|nr:ATP-binding protein [Anaeromyxobacteraceae bacterium]